MGCAEGGGEEGGACAALSRDGGEEKDGEEREGEGEMSRLVEMQLQMMGCSLVQGPGGSEGGACLADEGLVRLDLGVEELACVEGLEACSNLRSLSLNVNRLRRLGGRGGLGAVPGLEGLEVRENKLVSTAELQALPQLTHVSLGVNQLTALRGLADKAHLQSLEAENNCIGELAAADLRGCTRLERLVLYRNRLADVGEGLRRATRLTHLDLGRNRLVAATGLESCTRLETLILYENAMEEVELPHTPLLRQLFLNGNRLRTPPRLALLPMLQVESCGRVAT